MALKILAKRQASTRNPRIFRVTLQEVRFGNEVYIHQKHDCYWYTLSQGLLHVFSLLIIKAIFDVDFKSLLSTNSRLSCHESPWKKPQIIFQSKSRGAFQHYQTVMAFGANFHSGLDQSNNHSNFYYMPISLARPGSMAQQPNKCPKAKS